MDSLTGLSEKRDFLKNGLTIEFGGDDIEPTQHGDHIAQRVSAN